MLLFTSIVYHSLPCPFSMESTLYVILPGGVFFLVVTDWIPIVSYYLMGQGADTAILYKLV